MPNRNELACDICDRKGTGLCCDNPTECSHPEMLVYADRVIKACWKSPLDCNKCIDESAQRVSKLMQSQGHSG